jgi:hypothetical protein
MRPQYKRLAELHRFFGNGQLFDPILIILYILKQARSQENYTVRYL